MGTERSDAADNSARPKTVVIALTLLDADGEEAAFELASETHGVVEASASPGAPPSIRLRGLQRPVLVTIRLEGGYAEASGARFPENPHDAAWFAPGKDLPSKPGTAGDRFRPHAVSKDGKALTFLAPHAADGQHYRARFQFWRTLSAAARSGGPIIIND